MNLSLFYLLARIITLLNQSLIKSKDKMMQNHYKYFDVTVVAFRTKDGHFVYSWAPSATIDEESNKLPKLYQMSGTKIGGEIYFVADKVFNRKDKSLKIAEPNIPYYVVSIVNSSTAEHVINNPTFLDSHLQFYNGLSVELEFDGSISNATIMSDNEGFCPNCFFSPNKLDLEGLEHPSFECAYCNTKYSVINTSSKMAGVQYDVRVLVDNEDEDAGTQITEDDTKSNDASGGSINREVSTDDGSDEDTKRGDFTGSDQLSGSGDTDDEDLREDGQDEASSVSTGELQDVDSIESEGAFEDEYEDGDGSDEEILVDVIESYESGSTGDGDLSSEHDGDRKHQEGQMDNQTNTSGYQMQRATTPSDLISNLSNEVVYQSIKNKLSNSKELYVQILENLEEYLDLLYQDKNTSDINVSQLKYIASFLTVISEDVELQISNVRRLFTLTQLD